MTSFVLWDGPHSPVLLLHNADCRQTSSISHTKSKNLNVSHLDLQLALPNPLKPGLSREWNAVGAASTDDAPTISEWSTIHWLPGTTYIRGLAVMPIRVQNDTIASFAMITLLYINMVTRVVWIKMHLQGTYISSVIALALKFKGCLNDSLIVITISSNTPTHGDDKTVMLATFPFKWHSCIKLPI